VPDWITQEACIVVKTYPTPAKNGVEVSCTAAITRKGEWLRLFPIPFRFLGEDKKFKKYQWVRLRIKKASDHRRESFNIDPTSIELLSNEPLPSANKWDARKKLVFPLLSPSYCAAKAKRDTDGFPTLGIFRPKKIRRLLLEDVGEKWSTQELAKLRQRDMFDESLSRELEKIPYKFSYEFECEESDCPGHTVMCTDWEMGQAYRAWRRAYGADWERQFRIRFETEMIQKNDTHFYIGTLLQHPGNWIIVGLFYPMR